jgi:hypothetical protein
VESQADSYVDKKLTAVNMLENGEAVYRELAGL